MIELLAVMAIVAVLAGIISISVSGSGQTSRDTQSRQDATSVESALASYFGSLAGAEVLTFKVATVLGRIEVRQVISTSWPEKFISDAYPKVFPEGEIATVGNVTFLDSDGTLSDLTARGLLQGFNAIDFDLLFDGGFLTTIPNNVGQASQDFSNYLWLLEKSFASGGSGLVSSREVAVFKLTSVDEIAGSDLVDITYRLLFGGDFSDQHPVASKQTITTDEDTPISVTLAGTDLESCELTFLIEEDPSNGDLTSIFDNICSPGEPNADSASVTYIPNPNFNGTDSFKYSVIDGNGDDIGKFTVTINVVNDAPIADNDAKETAEDTPLVFSASDLLTNDEEGPSNESGELLTVTGVTSPTSQGGTVVLLNGQITYSPADDFNGEDQFTYTVTDNGTTKGAADPLSRTATVTITVTPVNEPVDSPWSGSGSGTTAEVSDGSIVPAVFTYDNSGFAASGSWQFETTAAAAGTHTLLWDYTANHAFSQVSASLDAFIERSGTTVSTISLVNFGPEFRQGGFTFSGTETFVVQQNDVYGFRISGSHNDSTPHLFGTLTVGQE